MMGWSIKKDKILIINAHARRVSGDSGGDGGTTPPGE